MKKTLSIMIITLFTLTGCADDTIKQTDFESILKKDNCKVEDTINNYKGNEVLKEAAVAKCKKGVYIIEYYKLASEEDAEMMFSANKETMKTEKEKDKNSVDIKTETKSSEKYTLITSENYIVTSRKKDTLIYVTAKKKYKSAINKNLKAINY